MTSPSSLPNTKPRKHPIQHRLADGLAGDLRQGGGGDHHSAWRNNREAMIRSFRYADTKALSAGWAVPRFQQPARR